MEPEVQVLEGKPASLLLTLSISGLPSLVTVSKHSYSSQSFQSVQKSIIWKSHIDAFQVILYSFQKLQRLLLSQLEALNLYSRI